MATGIIQLKENTSEEISNICNKIKEVDSSFNYEIKDNHLFISHESKDVVWKRLTWLINKVELLKGCKFKVNLYG